jgi:hypothetical protein
LLGFSYGKSNSGGLCFLSFHSFFFFELPFSKFGVTHADETLEAYGPYTGMKDGVPQYKPIQQCSDYPATTWTAMSNIEIKTGTPGSSGTDAEINWEPVVNFTDCKQNCQIMSNTSPGGMVYLYYNTGSKCYFFSGTQYIRVTRGETGPGTVDPDYPKPISNWHWGPFGANGIDAALYSGDD